MLLCCLKCGKNMKVKNLRLLKQRNNSFIQMYNLCYEDHLQKTSKKKNKKKKTAYSRNIYQMN